MSWKSIILLALGVVAAGIAIALSLDFWPWGLVASVGFLVLLWYCERVYERPMNGNEGATITRIGALALMAMFVAALAATYGLCYLLGC